jgi:hypothetical protein
VKRSATIALALAVAMSGSFAACAQAEQPTVYHHSHAHRYYGPHHTLHHHFVAHDRAPGAAPVAERPDSQPPRTNQMFQPYADPGQGDDDGLSRDPDDCMKGCIGGNPG